MVPFTAGLYVELKGFVMIIVRFENEQEAVAYMTVQFEIAQVWFPIENSTGSIILISLVVSKECEGKNQIWIFVSTAISESSATIVKFEIEPKLAKY